MSLNLQQPASSIRYRDSSKHALRPLVYGVRIETGRLAIRSKFNIVTSTRWTPSSWTPVGTLVTVYYSNSPWIFSIDLRYHGLVLTLLLYHSLSTSDFSKPRLSPFLSELHSATRSRWRSLSYIYLDIPIVAPWTIGEYEQADVFGCDGEHSVNGRVGLSIY